MIYLNQPSQINPFIYIVLCWAGIFLFFAGISFWLWRKGNQTKKKLKAHPEARFFENVEIHVVSKSKLSYNFSIPCKIDVAVFRNEIHFLPGRFSVFLFTNLVPSSVNMSLNSVEVKEKYTQSTLLKFNSDALEAFFKPLYWLKTHFECSLRFQNSAQREEFLNLTKSPNEKSQ